MPFKITSQHTPDSASISEYQLLSIKRRKVTKFFSVPNQLAAILTKNFCAPPSPLNLPRLGPESWTVRDPRVEPSTLRLNITDVPTSIAEPSTLKAETVEGSIPQARTLHENAPHHGRFIIQSGTIHAETQYRGRSISQTRTFHVNAPCRGRFHSPGPNLPR